MIRFGIIGIGNMGSVHALKLLQGEVSEACLSAVCDNNAERLTWAKNKFPPSVKKYSDYYDLLTSGSVDAVIIATPHVLHPIIAKDAFFCGIHVLTEKPAGIDTASVLNLNAAAACSGKLFGIMYNQRTNPLYQRLHDLVHQNKLGEIKRFVWIINNWYRTQAYYDSGSWRGSWNGEGGGVLLNQCPHNLDIWQWIIGMPVRLRAVCNESHFHNISVEDDATIYAEYENGASAVFITSTGEYPGTNRMEISGTKGKAVIENGMLKLWLLDQDERNLCFTSNEGMPQAHVHPETIMQEEKETAHLGIIQNFVNAILHDEPLLSPGYDGISCVELINAAYLSQWTDQWVSLPVDPKLYLQGLQKKQLEEKQLQKTASDASVTEAKEYLPRWDVRW